MKTGQRRLATRVVAGVGAVFWGWLFFGVLDLVTVVLQENGFELNYVVESGWGLLFLVLVAVPLVAVVVRPTDRVPAVQVVLVGGCLLTAAVLAWDWRTLLVGLGVLLTGLLVLRLGPGSGPVRRAPTDAGLVVLVLLAVPFGVGYAVHMAGLAAPEEHTWWVGHFPVQAALGPAVVATAALAAFTGARLPAWTAAVTAVWLGGESVVYPHVVGSLGDRWSWIPVLWGLALVAGVTATGSLRGRRIAARVVAGVVAAFWILPWFGLIDLQVVIEQDERFHEHYLMESGWGLLYLVLVGVPLLVLAARPGRAVPTAQLWVCGAAVLLGGVWGWRLPHLATGVGLLAGTAVVAWLGRSPRPTLSRPDPVLGGLAAVALPVALVYGWPLARNHTLPEDITNGVSHFPMQASFALAVVGVAALASTTRARLPAYTAAFSALWIGVESVVYPDLPGSLGAVGGWCAAAWAVLLAAATELARRRSSPS